MVVLGNERLLQGEYVSLVRGRRVGLVTNHSGVNRRLQATTDVLHACSECQLVALFGPEHGVRGDAADGVLVASGTDARTGVPVHSLYDSGQQPDAHMLRGIDVVVFDIQDVGARFYTYLYTMSLCMQACARPGIPFVVLDRPNPLGGLCLAGNVLDPAFASFVGLHPIPVQYGMTSGELAMLFNQEYGLGADLAVVPMAGWGRAQQWDDCGLTWVAPSPNMPTPNTARVYPGTCFLEGTNLSEGRGTTLPFEQIGAPYVDGHALADHLGGLGLPGVLFRPAFFRPAFGKHQDAACQGVQIHVTAPRQYQAVRTGFEILAAARRLWPARFAWRTDAEGKFSFDRLAGTDAVRRQLDAGILVDELLAEWEGQQAAFRQVRGRYLLYG
jgi:uncharacterized protein YbbC (DUF1343 family)